MSVILRVTAPEAFVAVMEIRYWPALPRAGVPDMVAVPWPLSANDSPAGSGDAGVPQVVRALRER